jgi:hypothetical protein
MGMDHSMRPQYLVEPQHVKARLVDCVKSVSASSAPTLTASAGIATLEFGMETAIILMDIFDAGRFHERSHVLCTGE